MTYGLIYVVINRITGKGYIGQTTLTLEQRWNLHQKAARRGTKTSPLHLSIIKHGADAFAVAEILRCDSKSSLDSAEIELIRSFRSAAPNGYNLRGGGAYGKHSEQTRQKMSDSKKGKPMSDACIEATRKRMSGRTVSAEQRAKISAALKGRKLPPEVCKKMAEARIGRRHSEESKALMSKNRSGIPVSSETRAKIAAANIGKKASALTRAKQSASHLARLAAAQRPSLEGQYATGLPTPQALPEAAAGIL